MFFFLYSLSHRPNQVLLCKSCHKFYLVNNFFEAIFRWLYFLLINSWSSLLLTLIWLRWPNFPQLLKCLAKTPFFWRTFSSNILSTFLSESPLHYSFTLYYTFSPVNLIDAFSLFFNSFPVFSFSSFHQFSWNFWHLFLSHAFFLSSLFFVCFWHPFFCSST